MQGRVDPRSRALLDVEDHVWEEYAVLCLGFMPDRAEEFVACLGLHRGTMREKIQEAYRAKGSTDRVATLPREFQVLAHAKSIELREAYEFLLNRVT